MKDKIILVLLGLLLCFAVWAFSEIRVLNERIAYKDFKEQQVTHAKVINDLWQTTQWIKKGIEIQQREGGKP